MRSRVRHELKTCPEFFAATRRGHKKFELCRDDRPEGFQVGDELLLKEWSLGYCVDEKGVVCKAPSPQHEDGIYSGRELLVRVNYVMSADVVDKLTDTPHYPQEGYVIMSVSLVP